MEADEEDATLTSTTLSRTTEHAMATRPEPPKKPAPKKPPEKPAPVRTQMMGEHGDDDLGYDPSIIPTERIPDDD